MTRPSGQRLQLFASVKQPAFDLRFRSEAGELLAQLTLADTALTFTAGGEEDAQPTQRPWPLKAACSFELAFFWRDGLLHAFMQGVGSFSPGALKSDAIYSLEVGGRTLNLHTLEVDGERISFKLA